MKRDFEHLICSLYWGNLTGLTTGDVIIITDNLGKKQKKGKSKIEDDSSYIT
jgi:hypothetical protein